MKALVGALRPRLRRRHSVLKQELKVWFDDLFIFNLIRSGHNVVLWSMVAWSLLLGGLGGGGMVASDAFSRHVHLFYAASVWRSLLVELLLSPPLFVSRWCLQASGLDEGMAPCPWTPWAYRRGASGLRGRLGRVRGFRAPPRLAMAPVRPTRPHPNRKWESLFGHDATA